MQGMILAAGRGARLEMTVPKCLSDVDGAPLIEHQLAALRSLGVERVTVVVGFEAARVRAALGDRVTYVENTRYATTDSLYSFLLAAERLRGHAFVLNGDVLFDPRILLGLRGVGGSALAFDSGSGHEDEEMAVAVQGAALAEMRKDLAPARVAGENVGVLWLERSTLRATVRAARRLVAAGRDREWLASAINVVAARSAIRCVDVAGLPWIEIDFPDDLDRARHTVLPAIQRRLEAVA
ncbi:MAG: NTP transferase domain-containing protein [Solirubrobacteraceae bacterium]